MGRTDDFSGSLQHPAGWSVAFIPMVILTTLEGLFQEHWTEVFKGYMPQYLWKNKLKLPKPSCLVNLIDVLTQVVYGMACTTSHLSLEYLYETELDLSWLFMICCKKNAAIYIFGCDVVVQTQPESSSNSPKTLPNLKDQMAFLCKVQRSFRTASSHCLFYAVIMNCLFWGSMCIW